MHQDENVRALLVEKIVKLSISNRKPALRWDLKHAWIQFKRCSWWHDMICIGRKVTNETSLSLSFFFEKVGEVVSHYLSSREIAFLRDVLYTGKQKKMNFLKTFIRYYKTFIINNIWL